MSSRRPISPHPGDEPITVQALESEIGELNRKYRLMAGDRRTYSEQSQQELRKQRTAIEKLQEDSVWLKAEVLRCEEEKRRTGAGASGIVQGISKMAAETDDLKHQHTRMQDDEKELDNQLKFVRRQIMQTRKSMGGVRAADATKAHIQRQSAVLENRLQKSLTKFSEALAQNKSLRDKIDSFRRERVSFQALSAKLTNELGQKKQEMAEIIEMSNAAYESRDNGQHRMMQVRERAQKDMSAYDADLRELQRALDQDRRIRDFRRQKEREREAEESDAAKKAKKVNETRGGSYAEQLQEKVGTAEEAFAKIQAATGIFDIDDLVQTFIRVEDQNFSLFNYVNELNNHIEKLEEQIHDTRSEIEQHRAHGFTHDTEHRRVLRRLEEQLARTEARAQQYEVRHNRAVKTLTALRSGVQSMFSRVGCHDSPSLGGAGVTEGSILSYLGSIEQRVNQILRASSAVGGRWAPEEQQQARPGSSGGSGDNGALVGGGEDGTASGGEAITAGNNSLNASSLSILPPTTADAYYSDDEGDLSHPLTREELRARTLRGMQRTAANSTARVSKSRGSKRG